MKVELLSPVGNMETLYQAIHNGCDAVYLGGKSFGARRYAGNFSKEELKEAVRYSHLYGVKVYVTVNTIIYENEVKDFLEYIFYLGKISVDALIMQDIGMIKIVKEKFPNMEVHASTQVHNQNDEGIKLLKSLGVTRVVFDREMSLEEINNISVDIEKEVFIHGALCVSYSGCCLFSSLNGGRSGNRGECVQCCRMPYKLYKNNMKLDVKGDYLLSTRELNTLSNLKDILDSKICSLKIEGRMKSPEYVGYVTRLYRKLIDSYYNKEDMVITDEEEENLRLLFNREFTCGYLFNSNDIMNIKTPNHQGIEIGKVIKKDNNYVYIKLTCDLYQEDGIRFKNSNTGMIVNMLYDKDGMLKNTIKKGEVAVVSLRDNVIDNDIVLKTSSKKLNDEIRNYEPKRIGIDINVLVSDNNMVISISDIDKNIVEEVVSVEDAVNSPTSSDDIVKSFSKLGDTIYKVNSIFVNYKQDIFIPKSILNEVRRRMLDKLDNIRINRFNKRIILDTSKDKINLVNVEKKYKINVLVRTEEQLLSAINNEVDSIYTSSKDLYNKYKEIANIFYRVPRVINKYPSIKNGNILATELGSVNKYTPNNKVNIDYTLNVVNSNTIKFYNKLKCNLITLSVELSYEQIKDIMKELYNVEVIVYGRIELMIMKYCPLKYNLNNCNNCKNDTNRYYLVDDKNRYFPIIHDNCITTIMNHKNNDRILDIERYKNLGIYNYRIDLFDESEEEVTNIINSVRKRLDN